MKNFSLPLAPPANGKEPQSDQEIAAPLPADPALFWQAAPLPSDYLQGAFEKPRQAALLSKGLGKFPFWSGEEDLAASLETAYSRTTDLAINLLNSRS